MLTALSFTVFSAIILISLNNLMCHQGFERPTLPQVLNDHIVPERCGDMTLTSSALAKFLIGASSQPW